MKPTKTPHLVIVGFPYGVMYGTDMIYEVVGEVTDVDSPYLVAIPTHVSSQVAGHDHAPHPPVMLYPKDENRVGCWRRLNRPKGPETSVRNGHVKRLGPKKVELTVIFQFDEVEDEAGAALITNLMAVAANNLDKAWRCLERKDAHKEFGKPKKAKKGATK